MFIQRDYTDGKWYNCGKVGNVSQNFHEKTEKRVAMLKQQQQQYPPLKTKLMQGQLNIMSILVDGNATNKKRNKV